MRLLPLSLIVGLAVLVGIGSTALANKPRGSTALPKTRNACNDAHVVTCRWDVEIVAESHVESADESGYARKMDAHWTATYRKLLLGLPTAAQQVLSENEPEGDLIRLGWNAKGFTTGTIRFAQSAPGGPNCSWEKSYRVPTLITVYTHLKLLTPLGNGIGSGVEPWHFLVNSYYNRDVPQIGDYCRAGNTEATELGMPESQCCRLGGPPFTDVSFEPFFTTKLVRYYQTTLRRLPFPWTEFWAGRSFTIFKKWHVAPVAGTVQSGSVTIRFTRRR